MRTNILYVLGAAAVGIALSTFTNKVEVATSLHEKPVLPRVLISLAVGGFIYLAGSEYRRSFEPQSYRDLITKYSL